MDYPQAICRQVTAMLSATGIRAIQAYGGAELWQGTRHIEAQVSAGGLAFILK